MRCVLGSTLIVLAACLAHPASSNAAEIYKWVDAKGVAHYTQTPPEGQKYERMNVGTGTTRAADPAPVAEPPKPEPGSTEEAIAKYTAARAQNCKIARDNLALFESSPDVQKDVDGDGKPEVLNAEQREAEIQRNRDLVGRSCTE